MTRRQIKMKVRVFPKTRQRSEVHVILAGYKTADSAGHEKRNGSCWYADNVDIREQGKSNELDCEIEQGDCCLPTVAPFLSENREQPRGPGAGFTDAPSCLLLLNVVIGVYSLLVPDSALRLSHSSCAIPFFSVCCEPCTYIQSSWGIFVFNAYN